MTEQIDKLIDAKIVSGQKPLRGDIRQGIRELMQEYAASKDERIAELELVASKAEDLYNSVGTHNSGRKWVDQKRIDELGFALCDLEKVDGG